MAPGVLVNGVHDDHTPNGVNENVERKLGVYDDVHFDPKLTPKKYQMKGDNNFTGCIEKLTHQIIRNEI